MGPRVVDQALMFPGCGGTLEPSLRTPTSETTKDGEVCLALSLSLNLAPSNAESGSGALGNVSSTHCGLSHWRVLNLTPVPQVREQEPNGVQAPQLPSRLRISGVSQMQ